MSSLNEERVISTIARFSVGWNDRYMGISFKWIKNGKIRSSVLSYNMFLFHMLRFLCIYIFSLKFLINCVVK